MKRFAQVCFLSLGSLAAVEPGSIPMVEAALPAYDLAISARHGQVIERIIQTIAHTSTLTLGFKKKELELLGKELDGKVDVFQFLFHILHSPNLRKDLKQVSDSRFKWGGFMRGVNKGLNLLKQRGDLMNRYEPFAAALGVAPDTIHRYVKSGDWDGFVKDMLRQLNH